MKNISLSWRLAAVCAGSLVYGQAPAHAQDYPQWFHEKIAPPTHELSVDDYLIELAKALPANCILDATGIDPQARLKPFPAFVGAVKGNWNTARLHVMDDFRGQASLAQQALGDNGTQLFWRGPNLDEETEAARLSLERHAADEELLVEAESDGNGETTAHQALEPTYKPLQEKWRKYWREAHNWDGQSNQVDISIKVADLPPDLRALTLAYVRCTLYQRSTSGVDLFSDEYWDTMRLIVDTSENNYNTNRPVPYLSLHSSLLGPGSAGRLGNLDEPRQPAQVQEAEPAPVTRQVVQAAPNPDVPPAPLRLPDRFAPMLFPADLQSDEALQVKVSLEAKRRPLKALVADLKKQSGVALALAADAPSASAPVTLWVSEIPLWKMMASLSRIYGVTWSKDGAAYTLRSAKLDPLNAKMLRRGYAYRSYRYLSTIWDARTQENNALARQIVRHLNRAQLNSPAGAPLSAVPQELRDQVRKYFQEENAADILRGQGALDATPLEGVMLRFAQLNIRDPNKIWWGNTAFTGKNAQMGAFTADGRFICMVFDRFAAMAPPEFPMYLPPGLPPFPPNWKEGDPVPPGPPKGWKIGDPVPVYPPGWKKGDPWPAYPEKHAAGGTQDGAPGGP